MIKTRTRQIEARFDVSLHPEIFFGLQVLSLPDETPFPAWRERSLAAFPRRDWALDLPSGMWAAVPDILTIGPTRDIDSLVSELSSTPTRMLQERFLGGLLHIDRAVAALLDEGLDAASAMGRVPRAKREWLAYIGLFPIEKTSPATQALTRVVNDPDGFRRDLVATLRGFWEATFSETWTVLLPGLESSVEEKRRLFASCSLPELLRHTLLPVEYDPRKGILRALRGGSALPVAAMGPCTFTPSVFNVQRLWTVQKGPGDVRPWFPYLEPDLFSAESGHNDADTPPDIALIFRALGDATRFAMVSLIGHKPRTSIELARTLSVSKPTVSHHIHILRSAGLIHEMEHGGSVLLSLKKHRIAGLSELALARIFESNKPVKLARTRRGR